MFYTWQKHASVNVKILAMCSVSVMKEYGITDLQGSSEFVHTVLKA